MSRKRDTIQEILQKKTRQPYSGKRWTIAQDRMMRINDSVQLIRMLEAVDNDGDAGEQFSQLCRDIESEVNAEDLGNVVTELERYIPIGLVACMEGYFRSTYASIIDYDGPYKENIAKLDAQPKFSLEMAIALQKNSLTIGEYVAHQLSTNNIDDVNSNVSALTGRNFLRDFNQLYLKTQKQLLLFPDIEDDRGSNVIRLVKDTFELRHIYSHEFDPAATVDSGQLGRKVDAVFEFLATSETFLAELLS